MRKLMSNHLIQSFILMSIVLCNSFLNARESKIQFKTIVVAPNLYMIEGQGGFTGGNLGLSIGEDGVVLIDDSMPPMLGIMQSAIKELTQQPIDFLINTHIHGDHTGNNAVFGKDGTWIIAHENLRKHFLEKGLDNKTEKVTKASLPVITFANSMNIHLNGYDAAIFHTPNAHTDGDSVIVFRGANVIHAGDTLFNRLFPYIDLEGGGSLRGMIAAQKRLVSLSDEHTKIIPGHGHLANIEDVKISIAMLETVRERISKLIDENKSEDEIVALNPLKTFDKVWSWGFITTEKMTRQIHKAILKDRTAFNKHKQKMKGMKKMMGSHHYDDEHEHSDDHTHTH